MNLKLACADFSFPLLSHDHVLDLISMLGFQGVDVGLFGGRSHVQPDQVINNNPLAARELAAKVNGRGLEIADIFLIPGDFKTLAANHPEETERRRSRELFQRILEFAVRCNARHMTALPGLHWDGESHDASIKRSSDELGWRVEQAKNVGVTFSIEAHTGSVVSTPKDAMNLLKMTPGLTLTQDYGHFTYGGVPDEEIEPLNEFASHFQARGACKSRLQASFKENTIDFHRALQVLSRHQYKGYIGIEYVWIDWERCNEVDNLSETILLRDHLRSVTLEKENG